jgi:hypothetical protein
MTMLAEVDGEGGEDGDDGQGRAMSSLMSKVVVMGGRAQHGHS